MSYKQVQPHLFTFTNSLRNSIKNTPTPSKNISLNYLLNSTSQSSHILTSPNDSISRDSIQTSLQSQMHQQSNQTFSQKKMLRSIANSDENNISNQKISKKFVFYENDNTMKKRQGFPLMQMDMNTINGQPVSIKIDLRSSIDQNNSQKNIRKSFQKIYEPPKQENIKVFVRFKPSEESKNCIELINPKTIKLDSNFYCFDKVFQAQTKQSLIFEEVGQQMCKKLFQGYNGTIFAYGQTGSGKTYTIFGSENEHGLIYRCIKSILEQRKIHNEHPQVKCSMVELYKEELIDMFGRAGSQLKLKQGKKGETQIQGLKETLVTSEQQIMKFVQTAAKNRKVSATKLNEESSRSHTLLTLQVFFRNYSTKMRLIDLAGSEKVNKSGAKGQTFEQTKKINASLSCLGNVINALTTRGKAEHIPFRDSKLTRLLKESLTGNFMTSIIVNCATNEQSLNQTVSSLKFAQRAKKIKVKIESLQKQAVEQQSIEHLHTIINQLKHDLKQTNQQLQRYRHEEQESNTKKKIFLKKQNLDVSNYLPKFKEKIKKVSENNSQSDLTARPIPSERAHLQEQLSRYCQPKQPSINHNRHQFFGEFSSLNVSKSIPKLTDSPGMSSFLFRQGSFDFEQDNPDFQLSFTVQNDI